MFELIGEITIICSCFQRSLFITEVEKKNDWFTIKKEGRLKEMKYVIVKFMIDLEVKSYTISSIPIQYK